jgi:hypothetical protein
MSTLSKLVVASMLVVSCGSVGTHDGIDHSMISFQTGVDYGSSFAGGAAFDKVKNRLFLTGGTYARGFFYPEANENGVKHVQVNSDCFIAAIHLPDPEDKMDIAKWEQPTRLGYIKDPEACSMVHFEQDYERVFLGASASGASMGRADIEGDQLPALSDVSLFGEVISLSLEQVYNIAPVIPLHYVFGGHGFFQSEVNYPFAITSDPRNATVVVDEMEKKPIYVASLYSKYVGQWAEDINTEEVDLSSPYIDGNVWGVAIQKIAVRDSNATNKMSILKNPMHMERVWMKNFETTNFQKLQATDLVFVNGKLLLVGSTYDFGNHFAGEQRKYHNYQDYDGFLVKLDPETGDIPLVGVDAEEQMKLRIQSDAEFDDLIYGICLHPANATGYVPYVYVVGYSAGIMADDSEEYVGGGFIWQVDLHTMTPIWKREVKGANLEANHCAVTEDGQVLYVVGQAKEGSALPGSTSNGGDDIWVRQYTALDGNGVWEEQIGSSEDESLAKGGAIVIDNNHNAIIFGNTRGSMGRVRVQGLEHPDNTNDLFIMTVTKDGRYLAPDPNPLFQISPYYFAPTGNQHRIALGTAALAGFIVFWMLMLTESKWKKAHPVKFLKDTFAPKRAKRQAIPSGKNKQFRLEDSLVSETGESTTGGEEDAFVVKETPKSETQMVKAPPKHYFNHSRMARVDDEKIELILV